MKFETGKIYRIDNVFFWGRVEIMKVMKHHVLYRVIGMDGDNVIRRAKKRIFSGRQGTSEMILVCSCQKASMRNFCFRHLNVCFANDERD